jgi:hypothetical protein
LIRIEPAVTVSVTTVPDLDRRHVIVLRGEDVDVSVIE